MNTGTSVSLHNAHSPLFASKAFFLWDFDGCFADTEKLHFLAYSQAFAHVGHTLSEQEYYPSFTHLGDGTGREIEKYKLKTTVEEINSLKKEYYWKIIQTHPVGLFPQTSAIVSGLLRAAQPHAKIAIASNSPAHEIELILKRAGYEGPLHALVGRTDELRKKPAPDIFLRALEVLRGNPSEALIFEDSERGLAAAQAAGCQSVWVRTNINERLTTQVPYVAQGTHAELLKALEEKGAS